MCQRSKRGLRSPGILLPLVLAAQFLFLVSMAGAQGIAASALAEIQALEQEKSARTPAQQKIDSNLIYAHQKLRTGAASPAATHLQPDVKFQPDGRVLVDRSEEHTSELQSLAYLVCRLLLEKKKAA